MNILGDSLGACIVHHLAEKDLKKLEDNEDDFEE